MSGPRSIAFTGQGDMVRSIARSARDAEMVRDSEATFRSPFAQHLDAAIYGDQVVICRALRTMGDVIASPGAGRWTVNGKVLTTEELQRRYETKCKGKGAGGS